MKLVTEVAAMRRLGLRWRAAGIRLGLVPTMGYLHEGHLSLIQRARRVVGPKGLVVVSIYVNPTQFGPREDLSRYPRDLARDRQLCRKAGADVIFAPAEGQMYPGGEADPYSTYVVEEFLSQTMEGGSRPGHFRGVATVVAKLFNLVLPEVAVFGAKDFQQAAVVQRMVRDLNFPVRIVVAPTVREADGLAMSSRNKYLQGPLRSQAVVLWRAIQLARAAVRRSRRPLSSLALAAQLRQLIEGEPAARVDYIAFFNPCTLQPLKNVARGSQLALAVFIGKTRLIDNASL